MTVEQLQEKIATLRYCLQANEDNLIRLFAFACGIRDLSVKGYTKRAKYYRRTPEDQQRLMGTVNNLLGQSKKLHEELLLLIGNEE